MDRETTALLQKYDVPIPRYTSYPTVPYWDADSITAKLWLQSVVNTFKRENGELCIYVHLPFCESLCTFCACNKRITKNHGVEAAYIDSVLREWSKYKIVLPFTPVIREIHLGGGTPTFFSPENLRRLIQGITKECTVAGHHKFSVEVHPNYTTEEHLVALSKMGFNRLSLGIQDFDPSVQFVINRIQTFEKTKEVIDWARKHGFKSLNADLIYGLPNQTTESIRYTIDKLHHLRPDRIAFYSYAHVPWKSKGQRRYTEADLPAARDKWTMYQTGRELLMQQGFKAIGMDHFALRSDKLYMAASDGTLHRNFMGYSTTHNKLIIGLGASGISDSWNAFMQNEKEVESYQFAIKEGKWPCTTGHYLSDEDLSIRNNILDLMCRGETTLHPAILDEEFLQSVFERFRQLEADNLIEVIGNQIRVKPNGQLFIRNICSVLDVRMGRNTFHERVFSQSI